MKLKALALAIVFTNPVYATVGLSTIPPIPDVNPNVPCPVPGQSADSCVTPAPTPTPPPPNPWSLQLLGPVQAGWMNARAGRKLTIRFNLLANGYRVDQPSLINLTTNTVNCNTGEPAVPMVVKATPIRYRRGAYEFKWTTPRLGGFCYGLNLNYPGAIASILVRSY